MMTSAVHKTEALSWIVSPFPVTTAYCLTPLNCSNCQTVLLCGPNTKCFTFTITDMGAVALRS